jgi:hypothetical protein
VWTMYESFDPFKPLVTLHLERDMREAMKNEFLTGSNLTYQFRSAPWY